MRLDAFNNGLQNIFDEDSKEYDTITKFINKNMSKLVTSDNIDLNGILNENGYSRYSDNQDKCSYIIGKIKEAVGIELDKNEQSLLYTIRGNDENVEITVRPKEDITIKEYFLNIDAFLDGKDSLTAEEICSKMNDLISNEDESVRDFAKYFQFDEQNNLLNVELAEDLIMCINNKLGVENKVPPVLSKDVLNQLNQLGIFNTIKEIISEKEFQNMKTNTINIVNRLSEQDFSENDIKLIIDYTKKYCIKKNGDNLENFYNQYNELISGLIENFVGNIDTYFVIKMRLQNGDSPSQIVQFVWQMIKDFCYDINLNENQKEYMLYKIINKISQNAENDKNYKWSDAIKVCVDELNKLSEKDILTDSEISSDEVKTFNYISGEIYTASVNDIINEEILFKDKANLSADDIYNNLDDLLFSNDAGTRKFAEYMFNAIKDINSEAGRKKMLAYIIGRLNINYANLVTDNPYSLNIHTIGRLNNGKIFTYIDDIINEYNDYSFVYNDFYQGDLYKVIRDDVNNTVTVINQDTGKTTVIDLNIMMEKIDGEISKMNFLRELESVPAEVLIDMWYESSFYASNDSSVNGEYFAKTDNIGIYRMDYTTFTHETGHALDHTDEGFWSNSEPFASTFQKELEAYLADGHLEYGNNGDDHYFTQNKAECFAEIYTFLMYGYTTHDTSCLTEYFSGCIELVKQRIEETRELPLSERRN